MYDDNNYGNNSDGNYSYNKRDLYEADYVMNDSPSSNDRAGSFYDGASTSSASSSSGYSEPKWEPNPDKYNTYTYNNYSGGKPPKKKKKWWLIPLIVILVLMVAFICVGVWYGFKYVDNYVSTEEDTQDEDSTDENTTISIADSSASSSSGIILTDVSSVVEEVMPAVVSITSRSLVSSSNSYWGFNFGGSSDSSTSQEVDSGIGSGTIVGQNDTELLILTSYHVVEDSSSLYVTFCDDESVDGYIKSSSEEYDIAVVAVPLEDISDSTLSSITMATLCTEQATVGEGVIVIGDALGYGQSVTTGIVSAVDREITVEERTISVIQTDAAINSGNSGGCVLNSAGQVIGISEAKISSDNVEGMCYAISISVYADLIQELLTTTTASSDTDSDTEESSSSSDSASSSQTAYLGIRGTDISSETASAYNMVEGIYVASVITGGGAEAAGMIEGDIIVGFEGEEITTMEELQSLLSQYSAGDTVTVTIMRSDGSTGYTSIDLEVTLTSQIQ